MHVLEMRVYWGTILLDIEHRRGGRPITIGEAKNTDVFISSDGLPADAFPLIRTIDGNEVLTFARGMDGEVEIDGELRTFAALRATSLLSSDTELEASYRISLPASARALVRWGGITFAFRFVDPAVPLPFKPFGDLDFQYANLIVVSFLVHIALIVTLATRPHDTTGLTEDLIRDIGPTSVLFDSAKTPAPKQPSAKPTKPTEPVAKANSRPPPTRPAPRAPSLASLENKRDQITKKLGTLFSGSSALDSFRSGGGGVLTGSIMNAIGTRGPGGSLQLGGLGLHDGPETGGPGGRGTSRDIGGVMLADATHGLGPGLTPTLKGRKERQMLTLRPAEISDALDASVIKKVITDNKAQVRYCYEVELQRDQALEGRVLMRWFIGATGSVVSVQVVESTLTSPRVGDCLSDKIRLWRFPQPAGGGVVQVNYPFVFKSN